MRVQSGQIRITDHADEEAQNDRLSYDEIFSSVLSGELLRIILMINRIQVVWW